MEVRKPAQDADSDRFDFHRAARKSEKEAEKEPARDSTPAIELRASPDAG